MFERYTEKARRVIFFARFEASQYGSPYIESEHILLGLAREAPVLMGRALGDQGSASDIRAEVERKITPRERISTSVEVPLTQECKSILRFAADEATQLGHRYIGPEHLLLGILTANGSVGGKILIERGAELTALREVLKDASAWSDRIVPTEMCDDATVAIKSFLAGMGWTKWADLSPLFAADAQFIDSAGKQWKGREEIGNQFESLLLPYAKKTVTHILESVDPGAAGTFIASVLWENVTFMGGATRATQRMTILVEEKGRDWNIFFIQVTPVRIP